MDATQRVIIAAAADLAARLTSAAARQAPGVAETAQTLAPQAVPAEERRLLEQLARQVVEAVLGLANKGLGLAQVQEAVQRAAQKAVMSRPELPRALAARLTGEVPRLLNLEYLVELAGRGLELPPAAAAAEPELVAGTSAAFAQVLKDLEQVAATDFPVLLLGETGTGKELLARRLHRLSPRRSGPLVAVNCAALPESLLESELFGHEKGAFTGASQAQPGHVRAAAGGTLFLDEIGEAGPQVQVRLLRVLEQRAVTPVGGSREIPVDFRLVAASHRDLAQAAAEGSFSPALLYRLRVVPIHLPPLRERRADIAPLLEYFLTQACLLAKKTRRLAPQTRQALLAYDWPGNVRELSHVIQRLVVLAPDYEIGPQALPPEITGGGSAGQERLVRALTCLEGVPARRVGALAALLAGRQGQELANQDLRQALDCSDTTAKNLLRALAAAGLLQATGSRGGRRYRVAAP
ncbi:MAG: sigma 54-interacting transcriptional regulator [Thermodesulfobacteriota bacterium]